MDATHPGARKALWSKLKEGYFDLGVRHFWLDEAEPEIEPLEYHNIRYYEGNGLEISSLYPYYLSQAIYEGQVESGQTEIINLTRSGWIGSQRLGALLWSGDIRGDFPTLRKHIKAGLNIGLAGIPWWTTDIGGFWADPRDDGYTEVSDPLVSICSVQSGDENPRRESARREIRIENGQSGSTGAPNEVWSFGEEAYEILSHYLDIRERLRPYIQKHMDIASEDGTPVMRPLFYDFPDDGKSYTIEDQYMFGPDILVAPVLEAGANSRMIYLPEGSMWKDALTGETFEGGQTIDYAVSIEHIPVFTRNGFDFEVE